MTDEQSAGTPCVADGVHARLDDHEERLAAVERRQDVTDGKLDSISRDIAAVRAEGNARQQATNAGMDRIGIQLSDFTRQLAAHTGAQEERNRLAEDSLRRWKKLAVIVGIFCTLGAAIGSTLLSDQEVASTIWVKWLHLREPWDAQMQPVPQPQETQFILPPREMEAV
ncbi:hypothetical protein BJI49_07580 [Acetobacter pasteurianus]|uniref:hypothetical protein n=1 Tax=Acetobacter pasteurianus TaxID=438 RepID=UPI0002DC8973|nr:hypothetical protein [Acetobacter pasteurianus]RCL07145.1 hypothetical protein BJI49_07580 [Acetobacter pasteurianus]GCD48775.1 hypothetical protein NBRC106471_0331 [Acetobacter pasteurianus subsp. pasteurianus LMG 1262 = NBRC 106471]